MVGEVIFITYVNNVEYKIDESDLISAPCAPRCHVHLICSPRERVTLSRDPLLPRVVRGLTHAVDSFFPTRLLPPTAPPPLGPPTRGWGGATAHRRASRRPPTSSTVSDEQSLPNPKTLTRPMGATVSVNLPPDATAVPPPLHATGCMVSAPPSPPYLSPTTTTTSISIAHHPDSNLILRHHQIRRRSCAVVACTRPYHDRVSAPEKPLGYLQRTPQIAKWGLRTPL
jgi:hypothetical protein